MFLKADNIDQAVNFLGKKIESHMNRCMPLKIVSVSSRDPNWMTPLVKSMLKTKARVSKLNTGRLTTIDRRISQIIHENR